MTAAKRYFAFFRFAPLHSKRQKTAEKDKCGLFFNRFRRQVSHKSVMHTVAALPSYKKATNPPNNRFSYHLTLAKQCKISLSTVKRTVNVLVKKGYIERVPQKRPDGGTASNRYRGLK